MMRTAFHENFKEATEKDYAKKTFPQNFETHQWASRRGFIDLEKRVFIS
jgi:hypothetical protein